MFLVEYPVRDAEQVVACKTHVFNVSGKQFCNGYYFNNGGMLIDEYRYALL